MESLSDRTIMYVQVYYNPRLKRIMYSTSTSLIETAEDMINSFLAISPDVTISEHLPVPVSQLWLFANC